VIWVLNSSDLTLNLPPNGSELGYPSSTSLPKRTDARTPPPTLERAQPVRAAVRARLSRVPPPLPAGCWVEEGREWVQVIFGKFRIWGEEFSLLGLKERDEKFPPFSPHKVKTFLIIYLFTKRVRSHLTNISFLGSIHPPPHHTLSQPSSYLSNTTRLIIFLKNKKRDYLGMVGEIGVYSLRYTLMVKCLKFLKLLYIIHACASIALNTHMYKGITLIGPWLSNPIIMIN